MSSLTPTTNTAEVSRLRRMPIGVPFILLNIIFERYAATSATNILVIYLHEELGFDMDYSTALYHLSEVGAFLFPTIGAILADGFWGLYKTLIFVCVTFSISCFVIAAGSVEIWNLPAIPITLFGMFLFIAGGSMRSCLATFGADQYKLPEQADQMRNFFFYQMMFYKIGGFSGRFTGPVLREDVKCLGNNHCYPLAFSMPGIVIAFGTLVLLCARKLFVNKPPGGNLMGKVFGCIFYGVKGKICSSNKKEHWLDHSEPKYGRKLVDDTKSIMRVMTVLVGISIFYSCFLQQYSRWIFQATQMNGDIGFYVIKPDQINVLNPLTAFVLTPFSNFVLYPLFTKMGIGSLVHIMAIGGFVCCLGFVFATMVEIYIQTHYISMMWLLPQFICASLSEYFVLASSLNFAYQNGPAGMKSVMTAMVYLTVALGDALIPIISSLKLFPSQAYEYIFFAILLFVNMIIFCIIITRLDFSKKEESETESECDDKKVAQKDDGLTQ